MMSPLYIRGAQSALRVFKVAPNGRIHLKRTATFVAVGGLLAACISPVSAKEYIPMYNFSLQGGQ